MIAIATKHSMSVTPRRYIRPLTLRCHRSLRRILRRRSGLYCSGGQTLVEVAANGYCAKQGPTSSPPMFIWHSQRLWYSMRRPPQFVGMVAHVVLPNITGMHMFGLPVESHLSNLNPPPPPAQTWHVSAVGDFV